MASEKVQTLTDGNFTQVIGSTTQPVLVDFWAEWCGPCRILAPTMDALADELDGKAMIAKLDVDENPNVPATSGSGRFPRCSSSRAANWSTRRSACSPRTR